MWDPVVAASKKKAFKYVLYLSASIVSLTSQARYYFLARWKTLTSNLLLALEFPD